MWYEQIIAYKEISCNYCEIVSKEKMKEIKWQKELKCIQINERKKNMTTFELQNDCEWW